MRNKQVIPIVRLFIIASAIVYCGTNNPQYYDSTERTFLRKVFWEAETTTHRPTLTFELPMLRDYTTSPRSNVSPLPMKSTKESIGEKYVPPSKVQTYFNTTGHVKKFTRENNVLVATSESGLKNSSTDATAYSVQDIQAKNFDLRNWNDLTDFERSTNVLGMVLPMTVDLVDWFHAYDYNFRNVVAGILNEGNFTANSTENDQVLSEARNIVYVAPTPLSNGTHISVCFMMKSLEESQQYFNAREAHHVIRWKKETLANEFELPSLTVYLGCPAELMVKCCNTKPEVDHTVVIVTMLAMILIIVLVVLYVYVRTQGEPIITPLPDCRNEIGKKMQSSSRAIPYHKHTDIPQGKREMSTRSSEECNVNRSNSRLAGQHHFPMVWEENRWMGNRFEEDTQTEIWNNMPGPSRVYVPYHKDEDIQQGKREISVQTSEKYDVGRSDTRLDGQHHVPMVRDENWRMGNRYEEDIDIEIWNNMPGPSRVYVPYHKDEDSQRGKRKISSQSSEKHDVSHSDSRLDGQRHVPMVREGNRRKRNRYEDDTEIEVTAM